jgi:hypothetical protein
MHYMHHLRILAFTLKLGIRVLHSHNKTYEQYNTHTILWQILNHGTNEGIAITNQNFVEINLMPSMWPILQYPHVHIPMIHWSIYEFQQYLMFTSNQWLKIIMQRGAWARSLHGSQETCARWESKVSIVKVRVHVRVKRPWKCKWESTWESKGPGIVGRNPWKCMQKFTWEFRALGMGAIICTKVKRF